MSAVAYLKGFAMTVFVSFFIWIAVNILSHLVGEPNPAYWQVLFVAYTALWIRWIVMVWLMEDKQHG